MNKDFLPFYLSRALLSSAFAVLVMGMNWMAVLFAVTLFGLFLLYLHSGWFSVDLRYPLMPLRRDPRGLEIQRKALIASIMVGMLAYFISPYLPSLIGFSFSANAALSVGIITYFVTQFILFVRT